MMKFKKKNEKAGFTLLFSIIVSILVLAVGASIISIALKQFILSGTGRESQLAFYAANTGLECALYWDLHGNKTDSFTGITTYVFPLGTGGQTRISDTSNLNCSGGNISKWDGVVNNYTKGVWESNGQDETKFRIAVSHGVVGIANTLYCAEVTVKKEFDPANPADPADSDNTIVTITSQGLNTCDPENDRRAVQRGLVLQYKI